MIPAFLTFFQSYSVFNIVVEEKSGENESFTANTATKASIKHQEFQFKRAQTKRDMNVIRSDPGYS